jgi:predicted TPR repeat methyltransferase
LSNSPTIHPLRPESTASDAPTPLFGAGAGSFVQNFRLAAQAQRSGRLDEAIKSYLELLALKPYDAELHNKLGEALRQAGKFDAAVAHHRLALSSDPDNPTLHGDLGSALRAAGRPDEGLRHHFRSVALSRDYAEGYVNLALCLRDLGRLDESVGCFERALALNPDDRRARSELGIALLMRGDSKEGFAAYEARKRLPETPTPDFKQPAWDGGALEGKRILLYPEQGLTDVLLFVRFARVLKRRGATVLVLCQSVLKALLADCRDIDQVVAEGEKLPAFDLHASFPSLPHLLGDDETLAHDAYLEPPADSRIKLGRLDKAKLRLGIFWATAPGLAQDDRRSAPLAPFLEFAGDPELLVFSLQGGARQRDVAQSGAAGLVHDVGRGIFDFAEAATALYQLDVLISVDAPIAHLAAAMGVKTWVLTPPVADWRWQLGAESPWYPTARLFRQPTLGDWESVFAEVHRELNLLKR